MYNPEPRLHPFIKMTTIKRLHVQSYTYLRHVGGGLGYNSSDESDISCIYSYEERNQGVTAARLSLQRIYL